MNTLKFKIGRGGRFNNSGHLTFEGIGDLDQEINENFFSYENLEGSDITQEEVDILNYCREGDADLIEKYNLGKIVVHFNGNVLMTDYELYAENGVGTLDIDGDYNTVFTLLADTIEFDSREYNILLNEIDDLDFEIVKSVFLINDEFEFDFVKETGMLRTFVEFRSCKIDEFLAEDLEEVSEDDSDFEYKGRFFIKN